MRAFKSGNTSRSAIDHAFLQDLPCSYRITSKGVRGSESGLILAWILSTILLVKDYSASLLNSVDPDHFPWGSGNKHDSENCVPDQPQVMLESFLEQEYIVAEPKWWRVFRVIYPERARSKCLRGYRSRYLPFRGPVIKWKNVLSFSYQRSKDFNHLRNAFFLLLFYLHFHVAWVSIKKIEGAWEGATLA
jgi:hypothetical protein